MRRAFAVFNERGIAFDVDRVVSLQQFVDKDGYDQVQVTFESNGFLNVPGELDNVLWQINRAALVREQGGAP